MNVLQAAGWIVVAAAIGVSAGCVVFTASCIVWYYRRRHAKVQDALNKAALRRALTTTVQVPIAPNGSMVVEVEPIARSIDRSE